MLYWIGWFGLLYVLVGVALKTEWNGEIPMWPKDEPALVRAKRRFNNNKHAYAGTNERFRHLRVLLVLHALRRWAQSS
jgi:hypothetical protein